MSELYDPATKSARASYLFAILAALASVGVSYALLPLMEAPIYVISVGAVAVSVWYGGFKSGIVTIVVAWSIAFALFVGDSFLDTSAEGELIRWAVALIVATGVVWVSFVMRRGREIAASAAVEAEATATEMVTLQELASALSAAVTPADVARSLIARTPALLGARGGAVALVDGDELVIADLMGVALQTHPPGMRMSLGARAPIAQAIATGAPVVVQDRATFESEYPDVARLTPYTRQALAVPLRVAGEVVGSTSYLFDRSQGMREGAEVVARIAADLGGQALERARLYEAERQARQSLDRILQVAPRFHADSADAVIEAICREARTTFDADQATLWRQVGDRLELVKTDPARAALEPGTVAELEDFPKLLDSLTTLRISFTSDVLDEARGDGIELVRALGVRSSLRTPIAIGDDAELMLVVSWFQVVSEPDPSTILIARRFADQAGLALEQLERRRAEAFAAERAAETRRLQEVTAALSRAATAADVSSVCIELALEAVGADAGIVVLTRREGRSVELAASRGYEDDALEIWRGFDLDGDVPFARAINSGEAIWALADGDVGEFAAASTLGDVNWATIPLKTTAAVRGALHLAFRRPKTLDEAERRWLQTAVTQCAQALERSRLLDDEQLLRRRSERLQSMTSALSNAVTRLDVAEVVVEEIGDAVGATGVAFAISGEAEGPLVVLASRGYPREAAVASVEIALGVAAPGSRAVDRRESSFFETLEELGRAFPRVAAEFGALDHESFFFAPLRVGRRVAGLVMVSWEDVSPLLAEERRFLESLVEQAAQALDRARHFESERTIAETLQQSVLPASLPDVAGIQLAASYLPGTAQLDVGGDWFDAITLPEGRLGLVVGDVVGKGVHAAASMGQLRNALRALSLDRMRPAAVMARLNRLAEEVFDTTFATVVYAVVDPVARLCRFTSAGHPPPVVVYPDGRVELLEGGRGVPLGAVEGADYRQDLVELPAGAVVLLYTDGLVERRGRAIDDGLDRLCEAVRIGPRDPEKLVDHVLDQLFGTEEREDDVALLVMRIFSVAPEPLDLRVPRNLGSLDVVRDSLRAWLEGASLSQADAQDVVLAGWEACANAVEHAEDPTDDYVTVAARASDSTVTLVVEDTGSWVPPRERTDRGLGLQLMRSLMSSVDVSTEEGGTRVTLTKALSEGEA
ncbi:MAG: SpoIIE family protein phosphatase [Gaiellaceae bacterium]